MDLRRIVTVVIGMEPAALPADVTEAGTDEKAMNEQNDRSDQMRGRIAAAVTTVIMTVGASGVGAQDWPQWRGPDRDGVANGFEAPSDWPADLNRQWSVEVGLGYATPVLVGDRIYQFSRQAGDEVMLALDAATGETIWRTAYPAPFDMSPATRPHGPGPKSTPTYAGGRLFAHGMTGAVTAFDTSDGRQLWQVPGTGVTPLYHTAMSPLVVDDLVIIHMGGHNDGALTAFDAATGNVRWAWDGDGPAYGSPMLFELGGVRQVVVFTQSQFVGVALETGALLWDRPFTTPSDTTSQTPILYDGMVIQAGRDNGITAFRVTQSGGSWTTEDVWHVDGVSLHMANAVVDGDVLIGLSHRNSGQYFGLDLDTGEVLWTSDPRQANHASITRTGNATLSLEDDAELVVIARDRERFNPVQRYEVADSETWTAPTLSGDRLFVKDVLTLTLWTLD